jgi:ferredoxin-like protein FixX
MIAEDVPTVTKECTICREVKLITEFWMCRIYFRSYCKSCDKQKHNKLRRDNRSHYTIETQKWRKDNKEKYKEIAKKCGAKYYMSTRQNVLEVVGNGEIKCVQCGFDDIRALQIDHIHGGGGKHFRESGSTKYYKEIIKSPELYQILCANCNWIKRYTNNEQNFYFDLSSIEEVVFD